MALTSCSCLESLQPLFRNLLDAGRSRVDPVDMGIEVDESFAALEADGCPSTSLYGIGPMLKGSLWETIAAFELRAQAL